MCEQGLGEDGGSFVLSCGNITSHATRLNSLSFRGLAASRGFMVEIKIEMMIITIAALKRGFLQSYMNEKEEFMVLISSS